MTSKTDTPLSEAEILRLKHREEVFGFSRREEILLFREKLLNWYDSHRRYLPWREDPTPYRIWVSEIMLQQTQVNTVLPYFERFLEALPDVTALANCDEETLLKLWQGLGYYRRARYLQEGARQVLREFHGEIPGTKAELLKLSGIGDYTAGAIASIAFNAGETAVDGNVLRVMSRILALPDNVFQGGPRKVIERETEERLSPERPGDFNQALMDIGATICLANGQPLCPACPFEGLCLARLQGEELLYPAKKAPLKRAREEKTLFLILSGDRLALRKRGEEGVLSGLWEFPMAEGHLSREEALHFLESLDLSPKRLTPFKKAKHLFSHLEWHMVSWIGEVSSPQDRLRESDDAEEALSWATPEEIAKAYSIPSAFKVYLKSIEKGDIFHELSGDYQEFFPLG